MPGKVGVKIKAGRNLPVMDRSSDTTDAYVEIKLGTVTHKTDVCRKSLNPQWNTDWYRFEVDDAELQDEPLQIRLMDYDTYSANDAIGKVNISLNPLCIENAGQSNQGKGSVMSGWIPVFDTMHGIRGEVNIIVKVDLFSDFNKFRQSSCGVQFFHSTCVPHGYRAQVIHGFVEELVVNDDPEYQWIDKIRTPRASNEARQVVFLRLSGQVQRKIGLKAINLGANAVIGYTQCFDLEGDVGVVARGIGTAVTLVKIQETINLPVLDSALIEERNLKYLDFLTGGNRNDTTYSSSKFDYDLFGDADPSGNLVYKILGIDDPFATKAPNIILKRTSKPKSKTEVIPEEGNSENEGMKQLLKLEDERGGKEKTTTTRRFRHHVKRITHSSRNMLNFKINAIKQKLNDVEKSDNESKSLSSSFSDISESAKNSLSDMRNMMKFRKNRRGNFSRSVSDGSAMASVLVSSILRGPSLDSISEGHDSARSTPIKIPKQENKSESMSNLSSNQIRNSLSPTQLQDSPKHKSDSMINLSHKEKQLLAKLPLPNISTISISTISSTSTTEERFSDDDEDDDEEDAGSETTTPNEVVVVDADTVSMVVKCVLAQESNDLVSDNWIQPGLDANNDREGPSTKLSETMNAGEPKSVSDDEKAKNTEDSETKNNAKQLQSILKAVSIDEDEGNWIEPGSTTDEPETLADKRRGSLLHDFRENLTERFHNLQEHMHLPHFHDDKTKINKHSIIETPMKTMLVDKANILGTEANTTEFIPKKLEKRRSSFDFVKALHLPFGHGHKKPSQGVNADEEMFANAMKTILMEPFALSADISECDAGAKFYEHQAEDVAAHKYEANQSETIKNNELRLNTSLNQENESSDDRSSTELVSTSGGSIGGNGGDIGVPDERDGSNGSGPACDSSQDGSGIAINNTLSPAKPILTANVGHTRTESMGFKISQSPSKGGSNNNSLGLKDSNTAIYRRSSDSDLSVTPKGNSLCVASERLVAATALMRINPTTNLKSANADNMDMLEYPFLTMAKYPPGFIMHLGATVAARSVKLLERVPNPDEPETRDSWWTELRMEIRSHARALGCNVVLGYSEVTTISDDVCVLSATGTAAVINMSYTGDSQFDLSTSSKKDLMVSSLDEREVLKELRNPIIEAIATKELSTSYTGPVKGSAFPVNNSIPFRVCSLCHIPYSYATVPFNVKMKKCAICKKGRVPDVLLATIEIPESLHITGRGCFMQAQVMRAKKDLRSESNAKEISDGLPFLEYELHRLLINKLKAKGMNAIFGLKAHVAIGERMIALIATGTAVYLTALPPPTVPKIVAGNSWTDKARLNDLQKSLQETFERNREIYQLKCLDPDFQSSKQSDTDDSDEETLEMDLNAGNKDTCVLEVDDIEDLEIISLLMEPCPPEGFHVVNTQSVPGLYDLEVVRNLQMFTQVWRAKLSIGQNLGSFPKHFQRLLQTIYFKLRSMIPCAICDLRFRLDLPESDEIQVLVTGMALGLGEPSKLSKLRRKTLSNANDSSTSMNGSAGKKSHDEELIFSLDEDQNMEPVVNHITLPNSNNYGTHSLKLRKNSPSRKKFSSVRMPKHLPLHERYGVDVTPLSYVPGGKIEKYLGNLNFFFIRESTSIRENGGISGFVHSFITELLAVVRAHISALGGNAMVSFYTTELTLVDNQHKNQGQCLISVGGDVVSVSYSDD